MGQPEHHISVVVPAYNAETTIAQCVESLIAQNLDNDRYRILVVDNGSRDSTREILSEFEGRITILCESDRGPSPARNLGISSDRGEIVAFIDADCVAAPDWLTNIVAELEDTRVGLVGGKILATSTDDPIERFGEQIHDHQKAIEHWKPPYVISMNSAVRRNVLKEVGLYNAQLRRGEDVDLSWRILSAGYRLHYASDAIVYHHNESSFSGLLKEGCLHGFYGVNIKRRHHRYLESAGTPRNLFGNLRRTVKNFNNYRKNGHEQHLYGGVFNGGKTIGSVFGSIYFRYFQL